MTEHVCHCICEYIAAGQPRQGEHHAATRFGDAGRHGVDVFLNGVHQPRTYEAMAGKPGWVVNASEPLHEPPEPHQCRVVQEHGPDLLDDLDPTDIHYWTLSMCVERLSGEVSIVQAVPA